jgi:hypothetical protein
VIETVAQGCEQIAAMPDPVGEITGVKRRPSGISVGQMRVPLGVFGMIYESRPNVTIEAASLAIKSGNACILRGGSEACSPTWRCGNWCRRHWPKPACRPTAVQLVQTTDRAAVGHLITMPESVDVIIPRGGKGLIERISREARVPVIKHLDGNCHVYVDARSTWTMAVKVTDNAKTQKYSPCNAAESCWCMRRRRAPSCRASATSSPPRAWRCAAARAPRRCWRLAQGGARHRGRLGHRIPGAHHQHQGRRLAGRGDRAHQPLRLAPHRRHPDDEPPAARCASCARSIRPA